MKVNAGDLTDSARDLIKQGLFLQVDEDAVERTYGILSEEEVAEEDADEQMPLAGGDAADEPMPLEGGAAGAMVPRPAGAPTGPPARHRSADDKAQELAELRAKASAASAAAAKEAGAAPGDAPAPPFAGRKAQPATHPTDAACGGRKRKRGGKKVEPLKDVTNATPAAKKPAAKKAATTKKAVPKKAVPKQVPPPALTCRP